MTDVFLGIIALGVVVLAVVQVAAIVVAAKAARHVGDAVSRLEQDVRPMVSDLRPIVSDLRPIVANLQIISAEAARLTTITTAQAERVDQMIGDLSRRVDATAARVHATIIDPAREAFAVLQGILAALGVLRSQGGRSTLRTRPMPVEEDDPLFIG